MSVKGKQHDWIKCHQEAFHPPTQTLGCFFRIECRVKEHQFASQVSCLPPRISLRNNSIQRLSIQSMRQSRTSCPWLTAHLRLYTSSMCTNCTNTFLTHSLLKKNMPKFSLIDDWKEKTIFFNFSRTNLVISIWFLPAKWSYFDYVKRRTWQSILYAVFESTFFFSYFLMFFSSDVTPICSKYVTEHLR